MTQSLFNSGPADWTPAEQTEWQTIARQCADARQQGQVVVLATGVFDLFHQEHARFLARAKAAGDFLVVGVESDRRVRKMKGTDRPLHGQEERVARVRQELPVDVAAVLPAAFDQPHHYQAFLQLLHPAILAVSSHSPYQERKAALMASIGGQLQIVHRHNPAISTTQLIQSSAIIESP